MLIRIENNCVVCAQVIIIIWIMTKVVKTAEDQYTIDKSNDDGICKDCDGYNIDYGFSDDNSHEF